MSTVVSVLGACPLVGQTCQEIKYDIGPRGNLEEAALTCVWVGGDRRSDILEAAWRK